MTILITLLLAVTAGAIFLGLVGIVLSFFNGAKRK